VILSAKSYPIRLTGARKESIMYKFRTNDPIAPHEYKMIIKNEPRDFDEHNMIMPPDTPKKQSSKHPYEPLANPVPVMV